MVFSTLLFVFGFMPLFFAAYYLTPNRYKNITALVGSFLFYFWGAPKFIFVVFVSMLVDWHLGNAIYAAKAKKEKKYYLILDIVTNVGLLVYFKYANFFVDNLFALMKLLHVGHPGGWVNVALPIGISFIVFEKITYCVDIYRGVNRPAEKVRNYLLYVFLFPQLIAGPIIQYHEVARKIVKRNHNYYNFRYGVFRFAVGLLKKVWVADVVAQVADGVFALPPGQLTPLYAWLGILAYALQIYFDFSGYADMAIGMMRMMGFKIEENFNMPYISKNITEFWRRWHISLGRWMKSYLYIPLGGNRVSKARNYFNLVFVFFISGFWHGASWNFVVWGVYHGLFLLLDKMFWLEKSAKMSRAIRIAITFFIVNIGWVLFRAENLQHAVGYLGAMFDVRRVHAFFEANTVLMTPMRWTMILLGLVVIFLPATGVFRKITGRMTLTVKSRYVFEGASVLLLLFSFLKLFQATFSPFIYFRF